MDQSLASSESTKPSLLKWFGLWVYCQARYPSDLKDRIPQLPGLPKLQHILLEAETDQGIISPTQDACSEQLISRYTRLIERLSKKYMPNLCDYRGDRATRLDIALRAPKWHGLPIPDVPKMPNLEVLMIHLVCLAASLDIGLPQDFPANLSSDIFVAFCYLLRETQEGIELQSKPAASVATRALTPAPPPARVALAYRAETKRRDEANPPHWPTVPRSVAGFGKGLAEVSREEKEAEELRGCGRYDEAVKKQLWVVNYRAGRFGEEHEDTILSLASLARTYRDMGEYQLAANSQIKVLDIRRSILGETHIDTIRSREDLAKTRQAGGQHKAAREDFAKALQARNELLGKMQSEMLTAKLNLEALNKDIEEWERETHIADRDALDEGKTRDNMAVRGSSDKNIYESKAENITEGQRTSDDIHHGGEKLKTEEGLGGGYTNV